MLRQLAFRSRSRLQWAASLSGQARSGRPLSDAGDTKASRLPEREYRRAEKDYGGQRFNSAIPFSARVRLIDEAGKLVGDVRVSEVIDDLRKRGLDIVEVAPTANPPVCRLFRYAEYVAAAAKRRPPPAAKELVPKGKKQASSKELRLSPVIDGHDLDLKVKQAKEFLEAGHHVRLYMQFRRGHGKSRDRAATILDQVAERLASEAAITSKNVDQNSGKPLHLTLRPSK